MLWLAFDIGLGVAALPLAGSALGVAMPVFLAVLLAAVVVTNIADLARAPIDLVGVDLVGTPALRVFLALAMHGLRPVAVGDSVGMIVLAVLAPTAPTAFIGALGIYARLQDRDRAIGGGPPFWRTGQMGRRTAASSGAAPSLRPRQ